MDIPPQQETYPERLRTMHREHGSLSVRQCGQCMHLVAHSPTGNTAVWKCSRYGITSSAATDWRLKWPACGLYQESNG